MGKILKDDYDIVKTFNNNVVLVKLEEKERIVVGKGIGFGKKTGDKIVKGTLVDGTYIIEDEKNLIVFNQLVKSMDQEFIGFCEELISFVSEKLNETLNESIHIGLIDHLSFAAKRLKNNEEIKNPFIVEIETLYQEEFLLAKEIAKRLEEYLDINIPDGEIGFITLHIHSARNNGKLSNTIKNSFISGQVVEYIEETLSMKIDKKSLDYARFIIHLRFAIERITTETSMKNDFVSVIKNTYKVSYSMAKEVGQIIEANLDNLKVDEDELAYLTMHIERFRNQLNKK